MSGQALRIRFTSNELVAARFSKVLQNQPIFMHITAHPEGANFHYFLAVEERLAKQFSTSLEHRYTVQSSSFEDGILHVHAIAKAQDARGELMDALMAGLRHSSETWLRTINGQVEILGWGPDVESSRLELGEALGETSEPAAVELIDIKKEDLANYEFLQQAAASRNIPVHQG